MSYVDRANDPILQILKDSAASKKAWITRRRGAGKGKAPDAGKGAGKGGGKGGAADGKSILNSKPKNQKEADAKMRYIENNVRGTVRGGGGAYHAGDSMAAYRMRASNNRYERDAYWRAQGFSTGERGKVIDTSRYLRNRGFMTNEEYKGVLSIINSGEKGVRQIASDYQLYKRHID